MQYDDTADVSSGHDITFEGQDLGPATIDSNNDGVADSVAVADGNDVYLITDADHDGSVDGYAVIDSSGHVTDAAGTDAGLAGASSGAETDTHQGTNVSDHTQTGAAGDITVEADGQNYDAGAPTADFTGDGHNDTAIVQGEDGTVNAFTDSDGDGQADTITQVDAEGHVTVAVADGHGGWEVAATGHLDANGNVVEDSGPSTDTTTQQQTGTDVSNHQDTTTQQQSGTNVSDHQDTTHQDTTQQNTTQTQQNTTQQDATHPGTQTGTQTDTTTTSTGAEGDISLTANGHTTDLGAPTADLTGDGQPDTVVSQQSDGTMVGYTDTDGDGQADTVTQISPDGSVVIGQSDGHGGWEQVATGHIDASGNFVQDGGDTTGSSSAAAPTDTGVSNSDAGYSTANSDTSTGVAQGESSTSTATSGVAQGDTTDPAPTTSTASSISGAMGNASNS